MRHSVLTNKISLTRLVIPCILLAVEGRCHVGERPSRKVRHERGMQVKQRMQELGLSRVEGVLGHMSREALAEELGDPSRVLQWVRGHLHHFWGTGVATSEALLWATDKIRPKVLTIPWATIHYVEIRDDGEELHFVGTGGELTITKAHHVEEFITAISGFTETRVQS